MSNALDYGLSASTNDGWLVQGHGIKLNKKSNQPSNQPSNHASACLRLLTLCLLFISSQVTAQDTTSFITVWKTTTANEQISFPGVGSYRINWGDSTVETVTNKSSVNHRYATANDYTISVSNTITRFNLGGRADAPKLREIKQWGTANWTSMNGAFQGATNMQMSATDAPNLSSMNDVHGVLIAMDMDNMFSFASAFTGNGSISNWDVSKVDTMLNMFSFAAAFNQNLNGWDVGEVRLFSSMFASADIFNGDISGWDVSGAHDMQSMFSTARAFNQDISSWKVGRIQEMTSMFSFATAFNQDISSWDLGDISGFGGMTDMFRNANAFRQNLGLWYAVSATNDDYDGVSDFEVLTLAAQNSALKRPGPVYTLVDGTGSTDNGLFALTEAGVLTADIGVADGTYSVRVGIGGVTFSTNNAVELSVPVTGSMYVSTSDISGDGAVNGRDALLLYYVLTFRQFVGDGARASVSLTAAILGSFSTARTVEEYQDRIDAIDGHFRDPNA